MFASAYMGRIRWAQPLPTLLIRTQKDIGQEQESSHNRVKAFEKFHFRPMYARANMGHPSREGGYAPCSNLAPATAKNETDTGPVHKSVAGRCSEIHQT